MVRNKRGERERREVREGECTGEQWDLKAVPSLSFVMVGIGVASSSLFVVVGVGVASSSSSVFILRCCHSLLSVVHRCPLFFRIRRVLLNCLALGEVESAGRRMILGR